MLFYACHPYGGILFPRMGLHVTGNGVFALYFVVPALDDPVNIILGEWAQQLVEGGILYAMGTATPWTPSAPGTT